MKHIVTTVVTALTLLATSAQAEFYNGNELLTRMNNKENSIVDNMLSLGYVAGVHDTNNGARFCTPTTATSGQVRDVVHKWVLANPEWRDYSGDMVVTFALSSAWPCPKKTK